MKTVNVIIKKAENIPYLLGVHDCMKLACDVIKAQNGKDYWKKFKGYKTKRGALVKIARIAPSLREAVSVVLKQEENSPLMAQRGDIVLYEDIEEHLGVCIGEFIVVLGENGLLKVSITHPNIKASWRIDKCQPQ